MTCDILDEFAARQTVVRCVPCKLNNVKKPENTEKVKRTFSNEHESACEERALEKFF